VSEPALTLAEAARMMRAAVRDKGYRTTPLSLVVGHYMRQKKWGGLLRTPCSRMSRFSPASPCTMQT
jgi:hypothetical protein